jgi:hypothetical protein
MNVQFDKIVPSTFSPYMPPFLTVPPSQYGTQQSERTYRENGYFQSILSISGRDVPLLPARTIPALHLSSAGWALIYCISTTICPHPGHRCLIMIVITGWYLEFSHIFISLMKMIVFALNLLVL